MGPRAPVLSRVSPGNLAAVYRACNYAFLFAPVFHPGMRWVAPIRRELGWRTIFNLLGPLSNPVDGTSGSSSSSSGGGDGDSIIEARLLGVARDDLGPVFADALRMSGARKGLVVCGKEQLDEVSCAGPTLCWQLVSSAGTGEVGVEHFVVTPGDFGLSSHALAEVSPGGDPGQNAGLLGRVLRGELDADAPLLEFVLMNTAALLVVAGVCEADESAMGPGDDGRVVKERGPGGQRWKEGVRRARWAIASGEAWRQWSAFVDVTHALPDE